MIRAPHLQRRDDPALPALLKLGATLAVLFAFVIVAGAHSGTRFADADPRIRARSWQGLVSQGGVTLGRVLVIGREFPVVGPGAVALGMALIVGDVLCGPIILKRALSDES